MEPGREPQKLRVRGDPRGHQSRLPPDAGVTSQHASEQRAHLCSAHLETEPPLLGQLPFPHTQTLPPGLPRGAVSTAAKATASRSAPEAELGETGVRRPRPLLSPQLHSALLPGRPLGSSETPLLGTSNPRDLKPRGRKGRSQKGLVASPRRGVQLTSSQGSPENSASPVTSSDVQPQGETPGKGKPKRRAVPCLRPGEAWVASSGCGVRRGSASTEGGPGPPGPRPLTCGSCPPSSGGRAGPSC